MELNRVVDVEGEVPIRRAIVSVSEKKGLKEFILSLLEVCPEIVIYSTGGTYTAIESYLGVGQSLKHLRRITEYTGQPEMQGGLVKTLDWKIYLGLLSETYNPAHQEDIKRYKAVGFDLVVVNLYPFRETIAKSGTTSEQARANIDIGGPCMIRASAKNFIRVGVVVEPRDYDLLLSELKKHRGKISLGFRKQMAEKAFEHTASYDRAIADYFAGTDFEKVKSAYKEIV